MTLQCDTAHKHIVVEVTTSFICHTDLFRPHFSHFDSLGSNVKCI